MKTKTGLTFEDNNLSSPFIDNSGFHNSIYRGKDVTSYLRDGSLWTRISSGKFTDLFIGDYFNITVGGINLNMLIASFDMFIGVSSTFAPFEMRHHAIIIPDRSMGSAPMNLSDTTAGGYMHSAMCTDVLPDISNQLKLAIGEAHLFSIKECFTDIVDPNAPVPTYLGQTGVASSANWTPQPSFAVLLSELEIAGRSIAALSRHEGCLVCYNQLPLFRQMPSHAMLSRTHYWLRTVTTALNFGVMSYNGDISSMPASLNIGIRPRFTIG